ncbi:MAG TPA: hypothetical protein VGN08_07215, partial [Solirubrobacteraceae bacterium]
MRARAGSAPLSIVVALVTAVALAVLVFLPAGASTGAAAAPQPPALGTVVLPAIGFGYTVTSQGPLDASQFPTGSPSASAASGALSTLGNTIETYQRSWQDAAALNRVQVLVVRFRSAAAAGAFVGAARRAIARGEIVSSGPLPSIPGARRTTYFASTDQAGVGQTITMRRGVYAAVLSFVSTVSGNPAPITRASAERVAEAQYRAMAAAGPSQVTARAPDGGLSTADVAWAVLGSAVLAA